MNKSATQPRVYEGETLTAVPVYPTSDGARGQMELEFPEPPLALPPPADEQPDTNHDEKKQRDGAKDSTNDDPVFR